MSPRKGTAMLTLQYVSHGELQGLKSPERIQKLLDIVKQNKIILLEGRLRPAEETEMISRTMQEIDDKFKGIEISQINAQNDDAFLKKMRSLLVKLLLGDRQGLTIIGPATIVKEIKQDPDKIQLYTEEPRKKR